MMPPALGPLVHSFFADGLLTMKGLRPASVRSYRDVLRLFLRFVAQDTGGAIAGGFILGMMESVGLTVLREYGDVTYLVIFALLMVFLSIRPNGLMGKPWG